MHDLRGLTRRALLRDSAIGLGGTAMASLLGANLPAGEAPPGLGVVAPLHHAAKAKRVIWLCMAGGASHLETLDPKPKLIELAGKPMPESYTKGQPIAQLQGQALKILPPQYAFQRFGKCGTQICELFPRIGALADDLCVVRSLKTEAINHDPAHTFMNSGSSISGRPAMGSWLWYGLGNGAQDLPGFVVMVSTGKGGQMQPIAARQWSAGFLPSRFQGVQFQSKGDPVHYLGNPGGIAGERQREVIDAVNALNQLRNGAVDDPEIATRISQYEMAFKMQTSVPRLMDLSDEKPATLTSYGVKTIDGSFNANCLLARRLAERGVRFIQLYHRDWDHHGGIKKNMQTLAGEVDQGAAALIADLKQRGLLDDTLVVWGGEFGRTPMAQGDGRDHHMKGFSMWLAGGGIKGGIVHGATDELGYNAVEDIVHVHDLHATMLHVLGIDHKRLTIRAQGRDYRLTDVHGDVVRKILV